jgi:hypothetical protein
MRTPIRYAGYLVLAITAVAVFVVLRPRIDTVTPTLPSATSYESLITIALDADTANNLRTAGAPRQQVVNGWTAKDLLTIIAKENIDILKAQGAVVDATGALNTTPFDERIPALLLIGVLALCWTGMSMSGATPAPIAAAATGPAADPGVNL